MATIINSLGTMAGWNAVTLRLFGRDVAGVTKVAYSDEQDTENQYGAGAYPVGQSQGAYKAKASIDLTIEERLSIQKALPRGTRLQDIPPFPIVVAYDYSNKTYKDVIQNCRFKNNGVDVKQGDQTIATSFELICTHIEWNT